MAPESDFAPASPGAGPGAAAETLACATPLVALPAHTAPAGQHVGQASGAAFTEDVAVSGGAAGCMAAACAAAGTGLAGGGEYLAALHGLYRQLGFLYCEQSQAALYPQLSEKPRSVYLHGRSQRPAC